MSEDALHFVKISFAPVSEQEMALLMEQDERLNDLFTDSAVVEYDGYERGSRDFDLYFYGADADRMASVICPELLHLPFSDRGTVLKRYGEIGAPEQTVRLK